MEQRLDKLRACLDEGGRLVWLLLLSFLLFFCLVFASWSWRVAGAPERCVTPYVPLAPLGLEDIEIAIDYPLRLAPDDGAQPLTALIRSQVPTPSASFELMLSSSNEGLIFVDEEGRRVPARLEVRSGYPDPLPYSLYVRHADTQIQGNLLRSVQVELRPHICGDDGCESIDALDLRLALDGRHSDRLRKIGAWLGRSLLPIILLGGPLLVAAGLAYVAWRGQRRVREKRLMRLYAQLRQEMRRGKWTAAQDTLEAIRSERPHYRDVDRLAESVYSEHDIERRREDLYRRGLAAYRAGDWTTAAELLRELVEEAPYYRRVAYLARTAMLYADLQSRDCSRRVAAAETLGQVADLMNMKPLLDTLGDRRSAVAEAAERAFEEIGPDAFETLLQGLIHQKEQVRQRAYRLLAGYGQSVRAELVEALHSDDPGITARVAQLLAKLGARQELADALLWIGRPHRLGVVEALLSEGVAAVDVLLETLVKAPPEREQLLIEAIAALKAHVDIDRRIAEALRAANDSRQRALLQRVQRAEPQPFSDVAGRDSPAEDSRAVQRLRRLERRQFE